MMAEESLPSAPTPFIGRQHELATLARMMTDADLRFVSILGPGGMGKSRLLLELGRTMADAGASSASDP